MLLPEDTERVMLNFKLCLPPDYLKYEYEVYSAMDFNVVHATQLLLFSSPGSEINQNLRNAFA